MLFTYCDTFCSFRTDKGVVMPKHVFLFSGSSAVGKTSILRYLIPFLEKGGMRTAICKIDCLSSNDESVYKNLNIPTVTGLSRDICPDHFLVSNLPELWDWCDSLGRDCASYRDSRALPPLLSCDRTLYRGMCPGLHRQQPLPGAPWSHGLWR